MIGITGFVEITRYERGTSLYYRLNPLTKVLFGLTITVVASTTAWWISAFMVTGLLLSYLSLHDGLRKFKYASYTMFSTLVGVTWSTAPFTPYSTLELAGFHQSTVLWTWPPYFQFFGYEPYLTLQQVIYGVQVSFRVASVIIASFITILTTTPSDLFRMLSKLKVPLAISFALTVAFTSVPKIFDLLDTSVKMQFLRGFGYGKPGFVRPFYMLAALFLAITPTVIYLARAAKNLAISVDTRAFMAKEGRTSLVELGFSSHDYMMFGLMIGLVLLAVLANLFGFGRTIPYTGL
nr:energy-coupling factor transporter transmembrane protein EcfT [Metallosphaera tengchongensis]